MATFFLRTIDGSTALESSKIEAQDACDAKRQAQFVVGHILLNRSCSIFDFDIGVEVIDAQRRIISKIVVVGFDIPKLEN